MRFSIVTVTRDNLDGLRRTFESLRAQDFSDYEWIVIDGASADNTVEFLKLTEAHWVSEPDGGIYDAMNKGLAMATGDYIVFMNAGDEFAAPQTLSGLVKAAMPDADFIYGDAMEGGNYKRARSHLKSGWGMFTHHQAMVYKRRIAQKLRFDTSYKIAGDYKFTLQHLKLCRIVSYVPVPLCNFECGGISQTQAAAGRKEQCRVRTECGVCAGLSNAVVYCAQSIVMGLRKWVPQLYWALKRISGAVRSVRSFGNTYTWSGQN